MIRFRVRVRVRLGLGLELRVRVSIEYAIIYYTWMPLSNPSASPSLSSSWTLQSQNKRETYEEL
jgi:hypothetical protein